MTGTDVSPAPSTPTLSLGNRQPGPFPLHFAEAAAERAGPGTPDPLLMLHCSGEAEASVRGLFGRVFWQIKA